MGGELRKWYGNTNNIINWKNNGEEVKKEKGSVIRNEKFFFTKGFSWKRISSGTNTIKLLRDDFIFDQASDSIFMFVLSPRLFTKLYIIISYSSSNSPKERYILSMSY